MSKIALVFFTLVFSVAGFAGDCTPDNEKTFLIDIPSRVEGAPGVNSTFKMFYGIVGEHNPERPTLMIIPGGPAGVYKHVVEAVKKLPLDQIANVVTYDHRGLGCTKAANPTWPALYPKLFSISNTVADIEEVRKDMVRRGLLKEGEKWYVFGTSYGGMVGQKYAIEHSDKAEGIVIGSTIVRTSDFDLARSKFFDLVLPTSELKQLHQQVKDKFPGLVKEITNGLFILAYGYEGQVRGIPKLLNQLNAMDREVDARIALYPYRAWAVDEEWMAGLVPCANVWDYPTEEDPSGILHFWDRCEPYRGMGETFDYSKRLSEVNTRVFVFGGARDQVTPIESTREVAALIPNAIYWENEQATHGMRKEKGACLFGLLQSFVAGGNAETMAPMIEQCQAPPELPE